MQTIPYLTQWIRSCARCRSIRPPIPFLCQRCWQDVVELRNKNGLSVQGYSFPVRALFTWHPHNDNYLRPLIYGLKGGELTWVFQELAKWFLFELNIEPGQNWGAPTFYVPQGKSGKPDHASAFANSLAEALGGNVKDLQRIDCLHGTAQKQKDVDSRREIQFFAPQNALTEGVIFVDDIITSGATAQAAFEALGRPKHYQVWTLASRPKLAGI